MAVRADCRDVICWSDDPDAEQGVANGIAEVLSRNWLEGASNQDVIGIDVKAVTYYVKQVALQ